MSEEGFEPALPLNNTLSRNLLKKWKILMLGWNHLQADLSFD